MDLLQNPFHILQATPRDDKHRIMELADEQGLLHDPDACLKARSEITNPRKRLSAEIAWLPGLSPTKVKEALLLLESNPDGLREMDNLNGIVRINLMVAGLSRLQNLKPAKIAEWILDISRLFDQLIVTELYSTINEDRIVSGFSEVTDYSWVESELNNQQQYCKGVIISALDNLPKKERLAAIIYVVVSATDGGKELAPILIHDIVDAYELESQDALEKGESEIKEKIEQVKTFAASGGSDKILSKMIGELLGLVQEWDDIAQPIQISKKSLGLDHGASQRLAYTVRGLAIHLFNEQGKLEAAQQITTVLQKLFSEVPDVAELIATDANTLEGHEKAKDREKLYADLKPISEAPSLSAIYGIGFRLYGSSDPDRENGSFMSTYYFTFFFFPIIPLCRYRVILNQTTYHFLGKAALRDIDKWHRGIAVALIAIFVIYSFIGKKSGSGSADPSYSPNDQAPISSQQENTNISPSQPNSSGAEPVVPSENILWRNSLKKEIENEKKQAKEIEGEVLGMNDRLNSYKLQLDTHQAAGEYDEYNALVPLYNSLVAEKKSAIERYNNLIDEVNQKVHQYNSRRY